MLCDIKQFQACASAMYYTLYIYIYIYIAVRARAYIYIYVFLVCARVFLRVSLFFFVFPPFEFFLSCGYVLGFHHFLETPLKKRKRTTRNARGQTDTNKRTNIMPPPPSAKQRRGRASSSSKPVSARNARGQQRASMRKLREKDPMEYYSKKIDKWLDAHPYKAFVLNVFFLLLTTFIAWMIFGKRIEKLHFEYVKPYLRETGWPKLLEFWKEKMPEKMQLSESLVEKVWANLGEKSVVADAAEEVAKNSL